MRHVLLPLSPCGTGCRSEAKAGEEGYFPANPTPHPARLVRATFSRKGRRKSALSSTNDSHELQTVNCRRTSAFPRRQQRPGRAEILSLDRRGRRECRCDERTHSLACE